MMMINTLYVAYIIIYLVYHHHKYIIILPMMMMMMMIIAVNYISFITHLLSKHCNSLSNGCVTKRTSSHSRYIGRTISTQTKMIARTKQDSFLSILTDHTKISFTHQETLQEKYIYIYISKHIYIYI
jgi:hypothetical protein